MFNKFPRFAKRTGKFIEIQQKFMKDIDKLRFFLYNYTSYEKIPIGKQIEGREL